MKKVEEVVKDLGGEERAIRCLTTHLSDGGGAMEFCEHFCCTYGALMAWVRSDVGLSRQYDQALQDRKGRDAERVRAVWDGVLDLEARDLPSWTEKLSASEKLARSSGLLRDGGPVEREAVMTEAQIREQLSELLMRNPDVRRALEDRGRVLDSVVDEGENRGTD